MTKSGDKIWSIYESGFFRFLYEELDEHPEYTEMRNYYPALIERILKILEDDSWW